MTRRYFFFLSRDFSHPGFLWIVSLDFAFIHPFLNGDVEMHKNNTTPALTSVSTGAGDHVMEVPAFLCHQGACQRYPGGASLQERMIR